MNTRSKPVYRAGFREVANAAIERFSYLGLDERKLTIAGIATEAYGPSFATATRRILGGKPGNCPEWLILGWAAIAYVYPEAVRLKVEADGFTIVKRKNRLDSDGAGAKNHRNGRVILTADGRLRYDDEEELQKLCGLR